RVQREGILAVQAEAGDPGQSSEERTPGQGGHLGEPGLQHGGVAPELVDHEAGEEGLISRGEEGERTVEAREEAAAVDVPHEEGGPTGGGGRGPSGRGPFS